MTVSSRFRAKGESIKISYEDNDKVRVKSNKSKSRSTEKASG